MTVERIKIDAKRKNEKEKKKKKIAPEMQEKKTFGNANKQEQNHPIY